MITGLSPRVRGNRLLRGAPTKSRGSIPASAGKPQIARRLSSGPGVYPRECGETVQTRLTGAALAGLSPRVRGNRTSHCQHNAKLGSIPASAGKPRAIPAIASIAGVYPRECGETDFSHTAATAATGLSPRVRGNPTATPRPSTRRGSIPASAGKPAMRRNGSLMPGVYPRECGETREVAPMTRNDWGLSPRVRGNRT